MTSQITKLVLGTNRKSLVILGISSTDFPVVETRDVGLLYFLSLEKYKA